jgi:hypothetical protein
MGVHWRIVIGVMAAWLSGCTCYKLNADYPEPLNLKYNLEMVSVHYIYTLEADGRKWSTADAVCARNSFVQIVQNDPWFRELGLKYPPPELVLSPEDQKDVADFFHRLDRWDIRKTTVGETDLAPVLCPSSAGYVLLVKQVGFTRTVGGVLSGMAQGFLIGLATLGHAYTVPILERSQIEFCVVDKNTRKVVFYCSGLADADPRNEDTLREHVQHIVRDFQKIKIE